MTTLVEAIRKKYEKLTECHIFETFPQKSPNRFGANLLFPARTLSMDCQQISRIGSEAELIRSAGHVAELDLACNRLSSWNEVFILLRCLRNLESLNLSQNPLGPNAPQDGASETRAASPALQTTTTKAITTPDAGTDAQTEDSPNDECCCDQGAQIERTCAIDVPCSGSKVTSDGSPILRFACYEPVSDRFPNARELTNEVQLENCENWWNGDPSVRNDDCPHTLVPTQKTFCLPIQLALEANLLGPSTVFPRLNVLALNATYVPWSWIMDLLQLFPNLSTLHVALNHYGSEEDRLDGSGDTFDVHTYTPVFPRLRALYYSDNGISSWWTVCRLGRLFPGLEHLVLLGNPLCHIPAPLPAKESAVTGMRAIEKANSVSASGVATTRPAPLSGKPPAVGPAPQQSSRTDRLFAHLHTLGLSETQISRWESLDALGEWMPNLSNLRLGNTLPVFQSWPESECRAHVIARLPKLTTYNRSAINSEEREAAEREFVRYYGQVDPALRPNRYWELERQHGRLEPLANIDLTPKRFVRVRVALGDKEIWHELNLSLKVGQVKRQCCNLFGIDPTELKRFKLFYFDQVMALSQGPEELKYPNRAIHSYQPESGDLFELVRFPDFSRSG